LSGLWAVLGVHLTGLRALNVLVILRNPDPARERVQTPSGTKRWDRIQTNLANLPILMILPLAGLDRRWGCSPAADIRAQMAALVVLALALELIGWAMMSNRFFSALVRIQMDRGHEVVSGGPCRYVRHPG
jgi:protein-S-isoprenylcysteine O-methyltransferase Ste14